MPPHPTIPPIAMLHCVSDDIRDVSLSNWCISRKAFLRLLDHLESYQYATTHFADIEERPGESQRRKVILSFDDCLKHLFDFAIPQLVQRKMKAAFYMPTAQIGGYNSWDVEKGATRLEVMNESDLKELVRLGFEVGSHSHHHIELKDLPEEQVKEEVQTSKNILESITSKKVYSFSYPYGAVPPAYQEILASAGYKYGVSIYQPFETALALRRFGVYEKDDTDSLNRKLSRRYKWFRKMYDVVKKY